MRKLSRENIVLWITVPITGCLLLWYVIFPAFENEDHNLFASSGANHINYSDDGFTTATDSDDDYTNGFEELQQEPVSTNDHHTSSVDASVHPERKAGSSQANYTVNTNQAAVTSAAETPGTAAANASRRKNSVTRENSENATTNNNTDIERLSRIAAASNDMRHAGEQLSKIKKGKDESKTTNGNGGGLLLLPPDDADPVDVPLDGGISVLIAAALGYGVCKTSGVKKKQV